MIGEDAGTRRERLSDCVMQYFLTEGKSPDELFK